MRETSFSAVSQWPAVNLIQGIKMKYKGKEYYFAKVYLGASEMGDFDAARASIDYREASESQKETVATRKAMTLASRVLLRDAYKAEEPDMKIQREFALRERARRKISSKIEEATDEALKDSLMKELEALPSLPSPVCVFPNDELVLNFGVSNMSGEGTLPVDNIRLTQAFSKINMFAQEDVEDFLTWPVI